MSLATLGARHIHGSELRHRAVKLNNKIKIIIFEDFHTNKASLVTREKDKKLRVVVGVFVQGTIRVGRFSGFQERSMALSQC